MITRNTDYSIQRLRGLSTDTKPTDVPNGSEFREMDTGKKFLFSAAGSEWIEQPCCGGGSGGGDNSVMVLTPITFYEDGAIKKVSETFNDVVSAINTGKIVFVYEAIPHGGEPVVKLHLVSVVETDNTGARPRYIVRFEPELEHGDLSSNNTGTGLSNGSEK